MFVIVGLGNPGRKYEHTRHNMGFLAIDVLSQKYDIKVNKIKFRSLVGEGHIAGQKVVLVKPQTFMNLSGEAVREVMDFYKLAPQELIVIYDDIDIPAGSTATVWVPLGDGQTRADVRLSHPAGVSFVRVDETAEVRPGNGGISGDRFHRYAVYEVKGSGRYRFTSGAGITD